MRLTKQQIKDLELIKPTPRICPYCNIECIIDKPFVIITQIAQMFNCPQCDYGGIIKVGKLKKKVK